MRLIQRRIQSGAQQAPPPPPKKKEEKKKIGYVFPQFCIKMLENKAQIV